MVARLTGSSVRRVEDPRILTGRGRYVDDVTLPGMLHAAFVRSPFPHARVQGIDVSEALRMPGVRAVLTASDLDGVATDLTPVGPPDLLLAPFPALARDTVRLVGDPVAVVLADSRARAEDGAELVEVDYDPLPGVGDMDDVLAGTTAAIFPELGTNVVHRATHRYGDTDAAFAAAERVIRGRFEHHGGGADRHVLVGQPELLAERAADVAAVHPHRVGR